MSNHEAEDTQLIAETRAMIAAQGKEGSFYPGVAHLEQIHNAYLDDFQSAGYDIEPSVPITAGIDETVRFIGSHISVLKPYLTGERPLDRDYVMVQHCLRTRNVSRLFDDEYSPKYGSFFTSLGGLARPERLSQVCGDVFNFLQTRLGVAQEDIRIKASSSDTDLIEACAQHLPAANFELDTEDPRYYTHRIGSDTIFGRNFNIALPSPVSGKYEDIGNIIVLESNGNRLGVEIALGDSTTLKQLYGLDHILDAYAIDLPRNEMDNAQLRKLEDALMTSVILYQEGLRPGASNNQGRILRSYVKALAYYRRRTNMSFDTLGAHLHDVEARCLPISGNVADEVLEQVRVYDNQFEHEQPSNKEDETIRQNLGKLALL